MSEASETADEARVSSAPSDTAGHSRSESENRLQTVIDNSPVILVAFDAEGTVTLAEGRDLALLGFRGSRLVGKRLPDLLVELPTAGHGVRLALAGESTDRGLALRGRQFEFRFRPNRDASGAITGVLGIGTDITDSVEAAHESGRREERWEALVAQSADVAVIADSTTTALTYVSTAITRLFGWKPEELIGRPGLSLVHPDDVDLVVEALGAVAQDASFHAAVEFRLQCADGSYKWVEETISNLADVPGVRGLVGNVRDITKRRAAEQALNRRDRVTRALAAKAADVALVVGADGHVRYSNPSASALLVAAEGETLDGMDFVHPDDRQEVLEKFREVAVPNAAAHITYRRLGLDGSWRWVEQVVTNCVNDPDIRGLVVNLREITERVEAQEALRSSETRYRLIAETAQEGIWATDLNGGTVFANQKMADLLGRPLAEFYEHPVWDLISDATQSVFEHNRQRRADHQTDRYDLTHIRPDGSRRIFRVSASPFVVDGAVIGSLAMISDITDARATEATLEHRANYDVLTGLANRTMLVDQLRMALCHRTSTARAEVAVITADIDQFKLVNDSFGHAAGDDLLVEVARRWSTVIGLGDVLAHFGGDEFVIVHPGLGEQSARALASRLAQALDEPMSLDGRSVTVTASIGIAVSCGADMDAESLLRYADAAMYDAKAKGRGRTAIFTPWLEEKARNRLELFNDLKAAIGGDVLELRYQPVIELATGRLLGVEALCRWNDPQRGYVPPDEFIAVAEETGLIQPLDAWVLRRACRDGAAMRAAGVLPADVYVAVNVSAGHLAQPGFEAAVRAALTEHDFPADALVLEVTESAVMDEPQAAQAVLESLQRMGVRVAVDDFGTGHSSLAYLKRLPVGTLKIDRAFIQHITQNADDRAIVTAVISLAAALNVSTTAEGIETQEDLALLQQLGCHAGQGFLWSPAVIPEQLAALIEQLSGQRFAVHPQFEAQRPLPPPRNQISSVQSARSRS